MGLLNIFNAEKYNLPKEKSNISESNAIFGQTQLGNNVIYSGNNGAVSANQQLLYVTTSSTTAAGRPVDMSLLIRNSTVMACIGAKARALSQLPIAVMYRQDDGTYVDAIASDKSGTRNKNKARQVVELMNQPNNFQSQYEFWYQWVMWLELAGETFTLWWRKDQADPNQTPMEMYNLDSTLITTQLTAARYPSYRLSTPSYGFNKDSLLASHQVMHVSEAAWQGSGGFNKGILAAELVALDQDIDQYANFVMLNGAKPSGIFSTTAVIPDGKYKEVAARLKEAWGSMVGSKPSDLSKPGQGMLLDQGMTFNPVKMLTLQDADCAKLKEQTMKRICGLFGVPPAMMGIQDQKYNNTQTLMDEFYKSTMSPMLLNIEQKLKQHLLKGYPNLSIRFDTNDFLKGAPLDQMNFASAGYTGGIMTANEAREYLGMANIDGGDVLVSSPSSSGSISPSNSGKIPGAQPEPTKPIPGSSPTDTGGGGGNQTRKMNLGK